ncbi:MAG TPA: DMT family transporter [Firmicutes bacterium]|nr:DMT family transporter [Candidatus Fermentithermobacillaceae bacterium]
MKIVPLLIAALAGASMAVQGAFNAVLGKKAGSFEASFIVHVIGAVLLGGLLAVGMGQGGLRKALEAPWWSFLGGPLSVLIIWGVLTSVGQIGVSNANTAIVAAQIVTAIILDCLGVTGEKVSIGWMKIVGAVLFIAGVYFLLRDTQ